MADKEEILEDDCRVEVHTYEGQYLPKEYIGMVLMRWPRSFKHANDFAKIMDAEAYYNYYDAMIKTVLSRPNTTVRLAVLGDEPDVVLGFSVTEGPILHYVEVKNSYRRNGIGRNLVPKEINWFSHLTKIGMQIWSVKMPNAKYIPFA